MITLADLTPGTIGFARHVRPKVADLLIDAGQRLLGEARWPHHVFVVTQAATPRYGSFDRVTQGVGPKIVQSMPSGAEEIEIGGEFWTEDYIYIRPDYDSAAFAFPMDISGDRVAYQAQMYRGVPYSFLDYAALAGRHLLAKEPTDRTWLDRYVTSSKHQICSQLADQSLSDAGWHVFDDGRLPQDVTPSALYRQMMTMPGQYVVPGQLTWYDTPESVDM